MNRSTVFAALALASILPSVAVAAPGSGGQEVARGQQLYAAHCASCHGAGAPWRERRRITDWTGLQRQVKRCQSSAGLKWGNEEIQAVSRYLNTKYYHFPAGRDD